MRLDVGEHFIEMRGPEALTGGDLDAFAAVYAAAFDQDVEIEDEDDSAPEGMVLSDDGVSYVPKPKGEKRKVRVTMAMVAEQRDTMLSRLITGWSYDLPLPYVAASRDLLPLAACRALDDAIKPHLKELRGTSGPKETTAGTGISVNGSKAESPSPLQV